MELDRGEHCACGLIGGGLVRHVSLDAAKGVGCDVGAPAVVGRRDRLARCKGREQHDGKVCWRVQVEADDLAVARGERSKGG
eukprot:3683285-Prymnesium_polylepis.1